VSEIYHPTRHSTGHFGGDWMSSDPSGIHGMFQPTVCTINQLTKFV